MMWPSSAAVPAGVPGYVTAHTLNPLARNCRGVGQHSSLQLAVGTRLAAGHDIVYTDTENHNTIGLKPPTFSQQVIALCTAPVLLDNPRVSELFPADVISRAQEYLSTNSPRDNQGHGGSWTSSEPRGSLRVRQDVARFIGGEAQGAEAVVPVNPEHISLHNGTGDCVRLVLQTLLRGSNDAILLPQPGRPELAAIVALLGGTAVGYQLEDRYQGEADLSLPALAQALAMARMRGMCVRAVVLNNPSFPAGHLQSPESIAAVLQFAHENGIVVIADQDCRLAVSGACEGAPYEYNSVRKVLSGCDWQIRSSLQLFSVNSFCGIHGLSVAYLEALNIDPSVLTVLTRIAGMGAPPSWADQVALGTLIRPPSSGDVSFESYTAEMSDLRTTVQELGGRMARTLDALPNVQCKHAAGALYCYPEIRLPAAALAAAASAGLPPADYYCLALLVDTGILVTAGSAFEALDPVQAARSGRCHFRLSVMLPEAEAILARIATFNNTFMRTHGSTAATDGVANYVDLIMNHISYKAKL